VDAVTPVADGQFQGTMLDRVLARACIDVMTIDRFQAGSGPVKICPRRTAGSQVERAPLPLRASAYHLSLDLLVGWRRLKLLERGRPQAGFPMIPRRLLEPISGESARSTSGRRRDAPAMYGGRSMPQPSRPRIGCCLNISPPRQRRLMGSGQA
jgi:hypothetical protein